MNLPSEWMGRPAALTRTLPAVPAGALSRAYCGCVATRSTSAWSTPRLSATACTHCGHSQKGCRAGAAPVAAPAGSPTYPETRMLVIWPGLLGTAHSSPVRRSVPYTLSQLWLCSHAFASASVILLSSLACEPVRETTERPSSTVAESSTP